MIDCIPWPIWYTIIQGCMTDCLLNYNQKNFFKCSHINKNTTTTTQIYPAARFKEFMLLVNSPKNGHVTTYQRMDLIGRVT